MRYVCNLKLCLVDWYSTLTPTFYEEAFRTLKSLVEIADIGVVRFVGGVNECSKIFFMWYTCTRSFYIWKQINALVFGLALILHQTVFKGEMKSRIEKVE